MNRFTWMLPAWALLLGAGMYAEALTGWGTAGVVLASLFFLMKSVDAHLLLKQEERQAAQRRHMERQQAVHEASRAQREHMRQHHRSATAKDAEEAPKKAKGHPDEHAWPNEPWRADLIAESMRNQAMWSAAIAAIQAQAELDAAEMKREREGRHAEMLREMARAAKREGTIEVPARWVDDPHPLPPPERTP